MNIINTSKIMKFTALSALVLVFGGFAFAAPQAHAGGYSYGGGYAGGYGHGGNSYYGGNTYYPSGHNSSSASAASASASSNSNTNVNVNVNVPVTVTGGYVAQPVYTQPVVYNYPTVPTYYNDYTAPLTYAYTTPSYNYNSYPTNYTTGYNSGYNYNYGSTYGNYYNTNSLSATCSANTTSANVGQPVTWSANVTGGSGYYTYSWSGSNNLYGSASSINATYNTSGQQYAEVTVTSNNGQSVTAQCSNTVVIGNGSYSGGNTNSNGLTIGCAAGASTVHTGTPVTWSVEATGGNGNYTYAWSGTDGLAGSQSSVATTYETPGTKQAVVIVTSSNGMTGSQSCTPITVTGYGVGNGGNGSGDTTVTPASTNNSGLSAASLFSLANIPWGWIAVLIILVLFGTVMYLLFNKNKI